MGREKINFNNLNIQYHNFADFYRNSVVTECEEHSFSLLPDINKAVETIEKHKNDRITIYGDYDCDGITATVTMLKGLRMLGYKEVDYYIPRRKEGYGMNANSVRQIIESGTKLVITVDTGITAVEYVKTFNNNGVEVVVTDHHEPLRDGTLPPAKAVVDCKRADSNYPFRDICGVVVAYKLIQALCAQEKKRFINTQFLPLAMMGTIADVMPLVDENRTIVKNGLQLVKQSPNEAFKEMLKAINKYDMIDRLKSSDIAFYIGPLINASSRVGDLEFAVKMLLNANDSEMAGICAAQLAAFNEERKEITATIEEASEKQIETVYPNLEAHKVPVVLSGPNWNKGVVGIVASHIVEKYGVPAIVMNNDGQKLSGSARSINDISMIKMLDACQNLLLTYGGHTGAAGLSLKAENLDQFMKALADWSDKTLTDEDYRVIHNISAELNLNEITLANEKIIESMEPFGEGNPEPRFYSELVINSRQILGKDQKTVKFNFSNGSLNTVEGIIFQADDEIKNLEPGMKVKVIYTMGVNSFRGNDKLQLMIQAIERM